MTGTFTRLRPLAGWLPLVGVVGGAAATWGLYLGGGTRSIFAWLAPQTLVPLAAPLPVIARIARGIWTRRGARRLGPTLSVGLVGLWPAAWLFGYGVMTYPYRLASPSPTATVRLPTDAPMRVLWYLAPFVPSIVAIYAGAAQVALSRPEQGGSLAIVGLLFGATAGVLVLVGWLNVRAARSLRRRMVALPPEDMRRD